MCLRRSARVQLVCATVDSALELALKWTPAEQVVALLADALVADLGREAQGRPHEVVRQPGMIIHSVHMRTAHVRKDLPHLHLWVGPCGPERSHRRANSAAKPEVVLPYHNGDAL